MIHLKHVQETTEFENNWEGRQGLHCRITKQTAENKILNTRTSKNLSSTFPPFQSGVYQ